MTSIKNKGSLLEFSSGDFKCRMTRCGQVYTPRCPGLKKNSILKYFPPPEYTRVLDLFVALAVMLVQEEDEEKQQQQEQEEDEVENTIKKNLYIQEKQFCIHTFTR